MVGLEFRVEVDLFWQMSLSLTTLCHFSEGRNTDRPDASAVYLQDFQRFLLHEQQVRGS